ncbi:MAG: preprotein translocase subunit SecE [Phycisphaerae bacterium]
MAKNDAKTEALVHRSQAPQPDGPEDRDDERRTASRGGPPPTERRDAAVSPFHVYKPGQGQYVRWCTAVGGALIALGAAAFMYAELERLPFEQSTLFTIRTVAAVLVLVAGAWASFWLVGQHRGSVEFMIATEGEMKKVNWSTRREVMGATKVVIVTVLALGFVLFVVDLGFIFFFDSIHVLRINILGRMFGGGES